MVEVWHVVPGALGLRPGEAVRCGCRIGPLVWDGIGVEAVCLSCGRCDGCCPCVGELSAPTPARGRSRHGASAPGGAHGVAAEGAEPVPLLVLEAISRLF